MRKFFTQIFSVDIHHNIIQSVIALGDMDAEFNQFQPTTRSIWLEAMGISGVTDENEEEKFHDVISEMLVLIDSCEKAIRRSDVNNQDRYIKQLRRTRAGIIKADRQHWGEFIGTFSDDFLVSFLKAASPILSIVGVDTSEDN